MLRSCLINKKNMELEMKESKLYQKLDLIGGQNNERMGYSNHNSLMGSLKKKTLGNKSGYRYKLCYHGCQSYRPEA